MSMRIEMRVSLNNQMLATSNGGQACELGVEKNIRKLWTLEPNSLVMS
jgi:hypothetical protein